MNSQMLNEDCFCLKGFLTFVTFIRFLSCVNSQMLSKIWLFTETSSTFSTYIGLLSCVNLLVLSKRWPLSKEFPTFTTLWRLPLHVKSLTVHLRWNLAGTRAACNTVKECLSGRFRFTRNGLSGSQYSQGTFSEVIMVPAALSREVLGAHAPAPCSQAFLQDAPPPPCPACIFTLSKCKPLMTGFPDPRHLPQVT